MDEPQHPPPHAGEPLTREDVERLIEEQGGPVGLDLREADLRHAELSNLDLYGADLRLSNLLAADVGAKLQGTNLRRANLQGARLRIAELQGAHLHWSNLQGAHLDHAKLQGADLHWANLQGAVLTDAYLQGAHLYEANLQSASLQQADLRRACLDLASLRDADLEDANWGDYILGQEATGNFRQEVPVYRALKQRHTEAGMLDVAGEFLYRELEARRKAASRNLYDRIKGIPRPLAVSILTMAALALLTLLVVALTGEFR